MNTTDNSINDKQVVTDSSTKGTTPCQKCTRVDKVIELESMIKYLAKELDVDLSDLLIDGEANKSSQY